MEKLLFGNNSVEKLDHWLDYNIGQHNLIGILLEKWLLLTKYDLYERYCNKKER